MQNLVHETAHFTVSQASGYRVPGYIIIESKSEITRLADFEPEAAAELMQLVVAAEATVEALTGAERVYVMKFAELTPRVHFHICPRTPRIGAAFAAATGAAAPFNGAALVAWLWDHHAGLGFTDAELSAFVDAARARLQP
jgi:diadenosine tetraphosphate (Ap4A) HIT family hydrolase